MNKARGKTNQLHLRGDNFKITACRDNEVILAGPSETGKTVACCAKIHQMCLAHPKSLHVISRKTQVSMKTTVLRTWAKIIDGYHVRTIGGTSPQLYIYPNKSQVSVIGLDNPDKLMSGEYDSIYVNQAEEISEADWEMAGTRTTGRAGNVPFPQLFGDANPAGRMHWIPRRSRNKLVLLQSWHTDNPSLYNEDGTTTAEGQKRLDRLSAVLTGVRRKRLLDGLWVTAEGAVYDNFDSTPGGFHVKSRDPSEFKYWLLTVDVGINHPAVILLVGVDDDGRWHVHKELYRTGLLPSELVKETVLWFKGADGLPKCDYCVVDAASAGVIADMEALGVYVKPGKGSNADGHWVDETNLIRDRLAIGEDGKIITPDRRVRLTVDPACTNTIAEFESYIWDPARVKEVPIKKNDHAMDSLRYLAIVGREPTGAIESTEGISVGQGTSFTPRQFTPRFQIIGPKQ